MVEFADVRILALGVLNKPRSSLTVNRNARILLHPPGVQKDSPDADSDEWRSVHSSTSSEERPHIAPPSPVVGMFSSSLMLLVRLSHLVTKREYHR